MLDLVFSNRAEALLEALAERVAARQAGQGFWTPVPIVVPNPLVKRFVREGLADRLGAAANLEFHYLESLLAKALEPAQRALWTPEVLTGRILARFQAKEMEGPLAAYLDQEGEDTKALPLAQRLASLFLDYALHRPAWVRAWRKGSDAGEAAWQGRLFAAVDRDLTSAGFLCPADLAASSALLAWPQDAFIFSLNTLAPAYLHLLEALKERGTVALFVLNPCEEFWADHGTRKAFLEGGEGQEGHSALGLWGRPGRDFVARLYDLSDGQDETRFEAPGRDTLLGALQDDIRAGRAPESLESFAANKDESLRVLSAPGPRREAEVVATEIWRLLESARQAGRPLRFSDIAVVIPVSEADAYLEHLRSAFEATHQLPLAFESNTGGPARLFGEAGAMLLELLGSDFNRAAVLRLLRHPASRLALPDLNPEEALALCERTGILRGLDARAFDGTYLEGTERIHWQQGLARTALAAFLPDGISVPGADLPALSAPRETAVALAGWLGRIRAMKEGMNRPRVASEWATDLMAVMSACFGNAEETWVRARAEARRRLASLERLTPPGCAGPLLSFAQVHKMIQEKLSGLDDRPEGLPGIRVSTCAPMRAVPFRVLFIMGLAEGLFPGVDRPDALDLRQRAIQPSDLSRAEQDRYLFLELLLSARDSLRLSYPDADPVSGDVREPSAALQELLDMLQAMTGGAGEFCERHPLRRFDDRYFANGPELICLAPEAWREAQALHGGVLEHETLPVSSFPGEAVQLTLSQVRAWLEDPLEGLARLRLGLRGEREDAEAREAESLELDSLTTHRLEQEALQRIWSEKLSPEDALDSLWRDQVLQGRAPMGALGEMERQHLLGRLQNWLSRIPEGASLRRHRFGSSEEGEPSDVAHPPLLFQVPLGERTVSVRLEGRTGWVSPEECLALTDKEKASKADQLRHHLRLYADQVALAAADQSVPGCLRLAAGDKDHSTSVNPPSPEQARQRLQAWIGAMLATPTWERLPEAYALELAKATPMDPYAWVKRNGRVNAWDSLPASVVQNCPAPSLEAARDALARRLGPLMPLSDEGEA